MAESETLVFRVSLKPKIYRELEISAASSLYTLAQAIVGCFDFDFDHAFGFFSDLKGNIYRSPVRYELFVDMGEGEDALLVRLWRRVGVSGRARRPKTEGAKGQAPPFAARDRQSTRPISGSRRRVARLRRRRFTRYLFRSPGNRRR